MNNKETPLALRLADLESMHERGTIRRGHIDEMLAELRRLHALNAELVGVLQKMDAACAAIPEEIEGYLEQLNDALVDVRAALAKAKEQT